MLPKDDVPLGGEVNDSTKPNSEAGTDEEQPVEEPLDEDGYYVEEEQPEDEEMDIEEEEDYDNQAVDVSLFF